jgi:hypothetical protein
MYLPHVFGIVASRAAMLCASAGDTFSTWGQLVEVK